MENLFKKGFISAMSVCNEDVDILVGNNYDLVILASGWDSRCLSITNAKELKCTNVLLIKFAQEDPIGLQKKHDKILEEYGRTISSHFQYLMIESLYLKDSWYKILNVLIDCARKKQSLMKILICYSTFPRYYSLGLLGACFRYRLISEIDFFYSEGQYMKSKKNNANKFDFSSGRWSVIPMPNLTGIEEPAKKRAYHISVGFEGNKTRQVVLRKDPDRVSILFPEPGYLPEYAGITLKANKVLFKEYKLPKKRIIKARAGDPIEAWKKIEAANLEEPKVESTYYLATGNKPHALALALKALAERYPTLLYKVPEGFNVIEVKPIGIHWLYKVCDLSAPRFI